MHGLPQPRLAASCWQPQAGGRGWVLAKVGGRIWLHRVTAEDAARVHIAGDNGMVNGWTSRGLVFGVLA